MLLLAAALACGALAACSSERGTRVDLTPPAAAELTTAPTTQTPRPGTPSSPPDPSATVSVGAVVTGFPADLVAPYPGAEVLLTSLAPSADPGRLVVTLAGRTDDAPEAVVDFYRSSLTAAGFVESPAPGGPGVLAATFTRTAGAEVLTVAVTAEGDEREFTVGGSVAAP